MSGIEGLQAAIKGLELGEIDTLIDGILVSGPLALAGTALAAFNIFNMDRVLEALRKRKAELTQGFGAGGAPPDVSVGGAGGVALAPGVMRNIIEKIGQGDSAVGGGAGEEVKEPETPPRTRPVRGQPTPPGGTGNVDDTTRLGRREFRRILRNFIVEEANAEPQLVSNENMNDFIDYVENNDRGHTRNINIWGIPARRGFENLLPKNNIGLPISEWLSNIRNYLNRLAVGGSFGGQPFRDITRDWWRRLRASQAPPEKPARPIEEAKGEDIAPSRPGIIDIGAALGAGAGSGAGADAHAGAGGSEAGAPPDVERPEAALPEEESVERMRRILSDLELPSNVEDFPEQIWDDLSPDDIPINLERAIQDALNLIGDGEPLPVIEEEIKDPNRLEEIRNRLRDAVTTRWEDLADGTRNLINNARSRYRGTTNKRLIGIIGALLGGALATGATIIKTIPKTTVTGGGTDDPPPPPPEPKPEPKPKECVKLCKIPEDDCEDCPTNPPEVPGDHGEHPEEMKLGDTFSLNPAQYINSNTVNRPSGYPPQLGLSFDSGEYDMTNPLIRGNMMNDAIRYGGKLFMPEMPLPPPPKLTRGYVNAMAPENINEIVTEKPQPNTGADLHAPFNRAFQEFDIDTGKVVNDFMKSQIARLSFGC